jgi:hypothetical protein
LSFSGAVKSKEGSGSAVFPISRMSGDGKGQPWRPARGYCSGSIFHKIGATKFGLLTFQSIH